jgi:uncharacterized Zn finger protein (UPF0148 family)
MAKQVIKSTKKYTPEQYCPICQVGHDKTYDQKIAKIEDNFNKSEKTDKDKKDYEEKLEKTVRGHVVLTLQRSNRGINTLVCQASVKQIHKTMQHYSAPHFEKSL